MVDDGDCDGGDCDGGDCYSGVSDDGDCDGGDCNRDNEDHTMPAGVHVHRSLTSYDLAALTLKKGVAVAAEALCGMGELLHELRDLGGGVDGALDGDDMGEGHVLQVARYDSGRVSHAARCPQVTSGHLRVHIR